MKTGTKLICGITLIGALALGLQGCYMGGPGGGSTGGGSTGGGNGDGGNNGGETLVKGPNISITNMTFSNDGGSVTLPSLSSRGVKYIIANGQYEMLADPGSNNIDAPALHMSSEGSAPLKVFEIDENMNRVSGVTAIPAVLPIGAESSTPRSDLWRVRVEIAIKAATGSGNSALISDLNNLQTYLNAMISNSFDDNTIGASMDSRTLPSFGGNAKAGVAAAIQDYLTRNPNADYSQLENNLASDSFPEYNANHLWFSRTTGDFTTATENALRDIVVDEFKDWTTSSNTGNSYGKGGTVSFLYDDKNNILFVPAERERGNLA